MKENDFHEFLSLAMAHYDHAREKHPAFADALCEDLASAPRKRASSAGFYKALRDEARTRGECTPSLVLWAEMAEVQDACFEGDYFQAEYEIYDCVAVLMRWLDMVREKQASGKKGGKA